MIYTLRGDKMFEGYVCKEHEENLKNERVVEVVEAWERSPLSDAPELCIYCGKETNDIFVLLEDF
jgi:hypothetical protein